MGDAPEATDSLLSFPHGCQTVCLFAILML
jgi:hypothetical protein